MTANRTVFSQLFDLPEEVKETELYPDCLPKELCFFAQTSKLAERETAFLRLQHAAVYAKPESYEQKDGTELAAIAILKRHPELLFKEGIVTDHFGRKIKASPYRLFLGAGDSWALKQVHDEIIPNIKDGEVKAKDEFKAQFPNCLWPLDPQLGEEALYDDRNKVQIEQAKAQIKIIVEKITVDPCTRRHALDETTEAIKKLCEIFAPKRGEIIKTGLHFPLAILKEIYNVYIAQFRPWSADQLSFFSCALMGAAEAALTAVDGQCCKFGLNNLDKQKGPDRRDGLCCPHPKGILANKTPIGDNLGHTLFVDPYDGCSHFLLSISDQLVWNDQDGRCALPGVWGQIGGLKRRDALENFEENKSKMMGAVCNHAREANTRSRWPW